MKLNNDFMTILKNFVDKWNGPKLAIAAAGVGSGISRILDIPGSSKVISDLRSFNDSDQMSNFMRRCVREPGLWLDRVADHIANGGSCVNDTVARGLARSVEVEHGRRDVKEICIGITGALTTTRWRRGNNGANICIYHEGRRQTYRINLPKLTSDEYDRLTDVEIQERRELESEIIATATLALATGWHDFLPQFEQGFGVSISQEDNVLTSPFAQSVAADLSSTHSAAAANATVSINNWQTPSTILANICNDTYDDGMIDKDDSNTDNNRTWFKSVMNCLSSRYRVNDFFTLNEFYLNFADEIERLFPNNNSIRTTIRSTLAEAVNNGYLLRISEGQFRIVRFPNATTN